MIYSLPYKTKQFFFLLIKLSIVVGAIYFVYTELTTNEELDFSNFVHFLSKNNVFSLKNVLFLLFLTIINWFFEIIKWRNLVSNVKKISFLESMEQSLGALTASLFTPNRIGEYGAKIVYFSNQFRKRIMLLNLLGNMAQMTTTTVFGLVGLWIFLQKYDVEISYFRLTRVLFIAIIVAAFTLFGVKQTKFRIKWYSIDKLKEFIRKIPSKIHFKNMFYSIIRYLIFTFQLYFLLSILGVKLSYIDAMILISAMYFLASIVPTLFIFDSIIKGSVAVYLFSFIEVNQLTILSAVTLMWILNFVIPSIFGSYFVLNFNWYNPEEE